MMRQNATTQVSAAVRMLLAALVCTSLRLQSSQRRGPQHLMLRPATALVVNRRTTTTCHTFHNRQHHHPPFYCGLLTKKAHEGVYHHHHHHHQGKYRRMITHAPFILLSMSSPKDVPDFDNDDDDEEEEDDDKDEDWRSFRAKLVMGENKKTKSNTPPSKTTGSSSSGGEDVTKASSAAAAPLVDDFDGIGAIFMNQTEFVTSSSSSTAAEKEETSKQPQKPTKNTIMTPLDPSQWAYDSGKVIEQGAVILGGVEQDYGFGLRQQYFHKAAILVLDHEASTFTRGIILNRPTDLLLDDDVNGASVKWRVWFGGDVQGITSNSPSIVCLHSLKSKRAKQASVPVMKDIQWTSFDNAKKLVKVGMQYA
jgi:Uncharacterized ACR, COG1678